MRVRVEDGRVVLLQTNDGRWITPCSVLRTARQEQRNPKSSVTLADLELLNAPKSHQDALADLNKKNSEFWRKQ